MRIPTTAAAVVLALVLTACGGDTTDAGPADTTDADAVEAPATEAPAPTPQNSAEEPTPSEPAGDDEPEEVEGAEELFPDITAAEASQAADGTWSFNVTVSSPYDTPERYADAWRILAPDGTELGVRVLTHDHANEQPFTRSLGGVEIPDDITTVTVEGRDQVSGWGGATVEVVLDRT